MSKKTIFQKSLWVLGGIIAWIVASILTGGNINSGMALIIGAIGALAWDENSWEYLFGSKEYNALQNKPNKAKKPNKKQLTRFKKGLQRKH